MRTLPVLTLAALSACAFADDLINIPIGRKVTFGTVRFEGRFQQRDLKQYQAIADWGIDANFDTRIRYDDFNGHARILTGDLSYNYITPIAGISPGISVGVQDWANKSEDGRRAYVAVTYQVGGADLFNPVELSFGAQYGGRTIGFVGLNFPFTEDLRFLAEHDGRRISAGMEWRQSPSLAFRYIVQDSRPLLSVRWQTHL